MLSLKILGLRHHICLFQPLPSSPSLSLSEPLPEPLPERLLWLRLILSLFPFQYQLSMSQFGLFFLTSLFLVCF